MPLTEQEAKDKEAKDKKDEIPWVFAVVIAMLIGVLGILLYAWAERSWKALGCALLIALASALVGALAGFIFGVPKSVSTAAAVPTSAGVVSTTTQYQGNTNLEQISDWLTKILVGAGLVELKSIQSSFNDLGSRFAHSNSLGSSGWVAAPSLVIAYAVCGFLLAYLWARIYMVTELKGAGTEMAMLANVPKGQPPAAQLPDVGGDTSGSSTNADNTKQSKT